MSLVLLLSRLLLAGVLIVAGVAKLADLHGSRQAMRDFGVPSLLATPLGSLLPIAELAVGIALLPAFTAWWGALCALALLLIFVIGIGYNLARGRKPDCHCFGQLSSKPIGWSTLIRNLLLAVIAAFIVGFGWSNPGLDPFDWLRTLALVQRVEFVGGLILGGLVVSEGWALFHVLRQQGRLLLRIEAIEAQLTSREMLSQTATIGQSVPPVTGLPVGTPAPSFAHAAKLVVALISRGTFEANRRKVTEYEMTRLLLQEDREVAEMYQAYGTPSAVLVRRDGTIGSPVAPGADAIRALIASAINLPVLNAVPMAAPANGNGRGAAPALSQPVGPKVGEHAPELRLPDLTGKLVNLTDFRGRKTLVLFWNPGCGFCQRMLDDLKAWEAKPLKGAPKLLVVSTGTLEANKAMGLRSPVLLDEGFNSGSKFGANGTPMAVLVDEKGKIASEVTAGAPAVLALAGVGQNQSQVLTT
jgi:peroxiredoxin/uncharacterized membrane protein YphA (DoxX/SURF4 family)